MVSVFRTITLTSYILAPIADMPEKNAPHKVEDPRCNRMLFLVLSGNPSPGSPVGTSPSDHAGPGPSQSGHARKWPEGASIIRLDHPGEVSVRRLCRVDVPWAPLELVPSRSTQDPLAGVEI